MVWGGYGFERVGGEGLYRKANVVSFIQWKITMLSCCLFWFSLWLVVTFHRER
jgi:hypothetical protein